MTSHWGGRGNTEPAGDAKLVLTAALMTHTGDVGRSSQRIRETAELEVFNGGCLVMK